MGILWNIVRVGIAAVTIVAVAELSKRSPRYGALLLSLPLVSILAFVMSWLQYHDLPATSRATADGTAMASSDYTTASGTLSFAPGETSKTVTVSVNGDTTVELNETFFVNLSNANNAAIGNGQGIGTILDDDNLPGLAINDVYKAEGNRGNTAFTFTVSLAYASTSTVTVQYATVDGTATATNGSGKDYSGTSGKLTFNPGETSKSITVSVKGDSNVELDESFFVFLSSPSNAVLTDGQGEGTIQNDDLGAASLVAFSDAASSSPTTSTAPALNPAISPTPTIPPHGPAATSNTADVDAYFASLAWDAEWLTPFHATGENREPAVDWLITDRYVVRLFEFSPASVSGS